MVYLLLHLPVGKHKKHSNSHYKYSNKYKKNYSPSKSNDKFYSKPKKKYYKKSHPKAKSNKDITCYNCDKKGHYSNKCKEKQKLKDKVNQLQINDESKNQLFEIFQLNQSVSNSSPDNSNTSCNYNSPSEDSDNNIELGCNDVCCKPVKQITVFTKQNQKETALIELISRLEDSELKKKYTDKLKSLLINTNHKPKFDKPIISLSKTLERFKNKYKEVTLQDLQQEINQIKQTIKDLQNKDQHLEDEIITLKLNKNLDNFKTNNVSPNESEHESDEPTNPDNLLFDNRSHQSQSHNHQDNRLNLLNKIHIQKWYSKIKIVISNFELDVIALIDTGADLNCIQEGLLPTKYNEKCREKLTSANGSKMHIKYKMPKVHICQNNVCFKTSFILVKNMTDKVILGTPFIFLLYPFTTSSEGITTHVLGQPVTFKFLSPPEILELKQLKDCSISQTINRLTRHLRYLKEEINYKRIDQQLTNPVIISQINEFKLKLETIVCSTLPTAFWHRKKHVVTLPYIKNFHESQIPTKSRPIRMNHELLEMCKKEINELLKN